MNTLDLDAIEARYADIPKWEPVSDGKLRGRGTMWFVPATGDGGLFEWLKIKRFIAHSRTDVPALVAEVRQLRAELEKVQA